MSKGTRLFIVAFTTFIVLLCIYYLSFTFKVNSLEKNVMKIAEEKVKMEDPKLRYPNNELMQFLYQDSIRKERINYKNRYLDSIQHEKVYLGSTYKQAKEQQLNLGLDLQGGMSVVLQASLRELLLSMADGSKDPNFNKALSNAEVRMQSSQEDYISLFVDEFKKLEPNTKLASIFATRQYADKIKMTSSDNDVIKIIREEASSAIQRTYSIITSRIDQFGTKQPTVNLDLGKARITVEIAGVDDPARVRNLLQATANLEFWETYKTNQIGNSLNKANEVLKKILGNQKEQNKDTSKTNLLDNILESGTTANDSNNKPDTAKDILGNIGKKKTEDTSEAAKVEEYRSENPLFSILIPSVDENRRYNESPMVGYIRALDTALLNQYLSYQEVLDVFPKDIAFMYSLKPLGDPNDPKNKVKVYGLYAIKKGYREGEAPLDGSAITDSRKDIDQSGQVVVNMSMNPEGTRIWSELTKKNKGNHIAIAVDNQVVSAPVVSNQIDGGNSVISGSFTQEEAQDLSNMLKIGKLPVTAKIIEEELVGPSIGEESIKAGLIALGASVLLIFIFMMLFYSSGGLIASLMMILNLFLIIGLMVPFGFTLTLPGIAGLVLTLGMAVDANVIIYERIKEEINAGKTLLASMKDGFAHSLAAIIDGNITTFITGFILGAIGMGPVKGFAVTLCIGILTTLFTAVLLTKLFVDFQSERGKTYNYVTPFTKNFLQGYSFDFIGKRKISYIISSTIIIIGIISMFTKGFDLGIDFKGGREYRVRFEKPVNTSDVRAALDNPAIFGQGTIIKQFGPSNQVKISTKYLIENNGKETDEKVEKKLYEGLKKFIGNTSYDNFKLANVLSSTKVDPSISVDFRNSSIMATIFSLIAIFIYILARFRKYGYSVGSVVATLHDALVVISLFSILHGILPFPLEVDQTFIAAILTIIGYSINDTVIIFDRLREYLKENPRANVKDTMNAAINSTLSRTFNTAFTVFIVVFVLFLFGGTVLKAFSFAMLIGVIVGIYSSVFIASPIMYDVNKGEKTNSAVETSKHTNKKRK